MTDTRKQNTIHEAVVITAAIANGNAVQSRYIDGNSEWKDRTFSGMPDFVNYQYRIKPDATWFIYFQTSTGGVACWVATNLDRAITMTGQANQIGRKLQYVIKVEGDVSTIQKTPQ